MRWREEVYGITWRREMEGGGPWGKMEEKDGGKRSTGVRLQERERH